MSAFVLNGKLKKELLAQITKVPHNPAISFTDFNEVARFLGEIWD
jgi:hypothetical protein